MTLLKYPSLNEIYAPIETDLKDFSRLLKEELASSDELIKSIHEHLLKMSGKFLRPVLSLLTAGIEDKKNPEVIKLAAAIELIHQLRGIHARPSPGFVRSGARPRSVAAELMSHIDQLPVEAPA